MAKEIFVEEIELKRVGDEGPTPPTAYCVVIDGIRSPLYFSRRDAEATVADAAEMPDENR